MCRIQQKTDDDFLGAFCIEHWRQVNRSVMP
nr:MAG TPA: hypothetical protein [Caudoviricetes sp.]